MNKRVWTVANPPRVYEVAMVIKCDSAETRSLLSRWGFAGHSASSRVPLPTALDFIHYFTTEDYSTVIAEHTSWIRSW
jgi:hypothetical protein